MSHISFSDGLLKHAEVLQVENRKIACFDSIIYFVERFPTLKAKLNGKMDILYDQFTSYQLLPNSVVNNQNRIDQTWCYLNQLRQKDRVERFDLLFEVKKHILVLPHSNAEEEKIFPTDSRNMTKFRATLSNTTTLPSIITCKANFFRETPCLAFDHSLTLIQKAKAAAKNLYY